jgi:hypothetical protein
VSFGVVGEGGLSGLARRQEEAGVQGVLGDVDADEGGRSVAHGVPPLWLMDAGSSSAEAPRDSVRGRGGPAVGPRSCCRGQGLIRCLRLFRPPGSLWLALPTQAEYHMSRCCSRRRGHVASLEFEAHSAPAAAERGDDEAVGESRQTACFFRHCFVRTALHPRLREVRTKQGLCPELCPGLVDSCSETPSGCTRLFELRHLALPLSVSAQQSGYAAPPIRSDILGDTGMSRLDRPSCELTRPTPVSVSSADPSLFQPPRTAASGRLGLRFRAPGLLVAQQGPATHQQLAGHSHDRLLLAGLARLRRWYSARAQGL